MTKTKTRLEQLTERLAHMEQFKANELAMPTNLQSGNYLADLQDSIDGCKRQIKYIEKNGEKIEVMNGGAFV